MRSCGQCGLWAASCLAIMALCKFALQIIRMETQDATQKLQFLCQEHANAISTLKLIGI